MHIHRLFRQINQSNCKYLIARNYARKLGSVALVTGASTGIGKSMCNSLLKAGVKNVIMSSESEQGDCSAIDLRKKYKNACVCFCKCDVTKPKEMENLFDQALGMFGHLDIVVNNAGILDDKGWRRQILINCNGVVHGIKLAMGCMSKAKGGKGGAIVNTASILGMQPLAGAPVYAATKYFVIGLTKSYGMDYHYRKSNVKVMAICPGITRTPLIAKANKEKDPMAKHAAKELNALPIQEPAMLGVGLVRMLKEGTSGSIWVVERDEIYQVCIPDRRSFRV